MKGEKATPAASYKQKIKDCASRKRNTVQHSLRKGNT